MDNDKVEICQDETMIDVHENRTMVDQERLDNNETVENNHHSNHRYQKDHNREERIDNGN